MTDLGFEYLSFIKSQTIGFGDHRDDIDNFRKLFHDDDVNGAKGMSTRINEKEAAVDSGILDITFTSCGEFLSQISTVLVLGHI
jgi:hypothetical protein